MQHHGHVAGKINIGWFHSYRFGYDQADTALDAGNVMLHQFVGDIALTCQIGGYRRHKYMVLYRFCSDLNGLKLMGVFVHRIAGFLLGIEKFMFSDCFGIRRPKHPLENPTVTPTDQRRDCGIAWVLRFRLRPCSHSEQLP